MTVIKVQVPLSTNDPAMAEMALIYAEGRNRMVQQKLDPATKTAMASDVKAFFEGSFRAGRWEIGRRVNDRSW